MAEFQKKTAAELIEQAKQGINPGELQILQAVHELEVGLNEVVKKFQTDIVALTRITDALAHQMTVVSAKTVSELEQLKAKTVGYQDPRA